MGEKPPASRTSLSVVSVLAFASSGACDRVAGSLLVPFGIAFLLSGLDDLFLDICFLVNWLKRRGGRPSQPRAPIPEKHLAIFVPLWGESAVIAGMVEHNLSAIRYANYEFFIGAYPNDEPTLDAVRDLERRFPRVHLATCPHDGPTSKADCLNWIYQRMLCYEEQQQTSFDLVVTHDAEDLIHPEALARINAEAENFGMVQIPVLPLPSPLTSWVHGVYCDEFAEWQLKDMRMRSAMGSFVPSNGVGTGYTREALDRLAIEDHNLVFEPACLTEDYENGVRLHRLGVPQTFVPVGGASTREYFPNTLRGAVRQRTRWVTGIALQTWERYGWRGGPAQVYWFWRDRKGLLGNPLTLMANFLFAYGLATWAAAHWAGSAWGLAGHVRNPQLLWITAALQTERLAVRWGCTASIYGVRFALLVPVRALLANYINAMASIRAICIYAHARLTGQPLIWLKTEHAYPSRSALAEHKRKLGEVLAGSGYISEEVLAGALREQPLGMRLGEFLVSRGDITEHDLYEALSLQQSLPSGDLAPDAVDTPISRILPRRLVRTWKVLPFQIARGSLFLASPDIPTDEMTRAVRDFTQLSLRFHLVTPANFENLVRLLL
jgi:bacteriophage N4 adsorption protein B